MKICLLYANDISMENSEETNKQTKQLWLHLAKGAFDYCCCSLCNSQKIVLGTWESLAEVGAAEAVDGVEVGVAFRIVDAITTQFSFRF